MAGSRCGDGEIREEAGAGLWVRGLGSGCDSRLGQRVPIARHRVAPFLCTML